MYRAQDLGSARYQPLYFYQEQEEHTGTPGVEEVQRDSEEIYRS